MENLAAYLTIRDAAQFLGVSANTLRSWGSTGKISMYRNPLNHYRLFKRSDLERVLKLVAKSKDKPARRQRKAK